MQTSIQTLILTHIQEIFAETYADTLRRVQTPDRLKQSPIQTLIQIPNILNTYTNTEPIKHIYGHLHRSLRTDADTFTDTHLRSDLQYNDTYADTLQTYTDTYSDP